MGRSVKTVRDEDSIVGLVFLGLKSLGNFSELVVDLANYIESHFDLFLRLVCFHSSANDRNVSVFFADAVHVGDHHDVNVYH